MTNVPDAATDRVANPSDIDTEAPTGDPELAALVQKVREASAGDETADLSPQDTSPTAEPGVEATLVLPLAPAVS